MHPAKHEAFISFETHQTIVDEIEGACCKPQLILISDELTLRGYLSCSCCGNPLAEGMVKGRNKKYLYCWSAQKGCEKYSKVIKRNLIESDFVT